MKPSVRIIAIILVAILLCSSLAMLLSFFVSAATDYAEITNCEVFSVTRSDGGVMGTKISNGLLYDIKLEYVQKIDTLDISYKGKIVPTSSSSYSLYSGNPSAFTTASSSNQTSIALELIGIDTNGFATIQATVKNAKCLTDTRAQLIFDIADDGGHFVSSDTSLQKISYGNVRVNANIQSYLLTGSSGGSSGGSTTNDSVDIPKPDIIIENVYCYDTNGNRLEEITEDTPPFTVEVIYVDYGMRGYIYGNYDYADEDLQVYLTNSSGLISTGGSRGTITYLPNFADDIPRYRVTFKKMTFDGKSNTLTFRTQYLVDDGSSAKGDSPTITVYQAKTDADTKDKLAPLIPHLIVSNYSYGDENITAGNAFTLTTTVKNTSATLPLENIVMTIAPATTVNSTTNSAATVGLTITSASNTFYIDYIPAGGSISHSIDLRAEPNAAAGSHNVDVKFEFQYVDEVNKKRETGEDAVKIAIPVIQIDRFSVDPLTQIPFSLVVGQEDYITVSFVNRGKSNTSNVSGIITGNISATGQTQNFGNLEPGKSGTLDFSILALEAGEVSGEITIQYEDDNTNPNEAVLHEVVMPFSIVAEEPYYPPPPPPIITDIAPDGANQVSVILCSVGGVLIAVPLSLYLFKRVRAKGMEDLDEDI